MSGPGDGANAEELRFWLKSEEPEAKTWRETAPAGEWARVLIAYRKAEAGGRERRSMFSERRGKDGNRKTSVPD